MDILWTGLAIGAALLLLCGWLFVRFVRGKSPDADDRYAPERMLVTDQMQMLDYLHDTFPGQVVLPNVALKDMLSVRRAKDKSRASQRLNEHKVDFVVCDPEGKPTFAFDIERYHLSNADAWAERVKVKNRMLKTAGVRFVFLKNGIHRMPAPAEFRAQLKLAELPKPKSGTTPKPQTDADRDSVLKELESQLSGFDHQYNGSPNTGFRDSEVMGLSGLMDLDPDSRHRAPRGHSRRGR
ncbi:DUF2726 domain-containing protein [Hydrogenophaga sp.]|uniref:DUF2726 domain-containing protein n=1 Tax=Hydrogenophaga sp. TaxID=1904254 RepID=UPI0035B0053F